MNTDAGTSGSNSNANSVGSQKSPDELLKEIETLREHNAKLLGEKKKVSEKYGSLEQQLKEKEEKELKEKEDFKTLLKLREEELEKNKKDLEQERFQRQQGMKLDAVLSLVDGKIDQKFWGMIDLEQIKLNPDSGQPDQMSVSQYVENFKKTYPELIKTGIPQTTPPNAPQNGEILTYEKWLSLPAKDQKARYKEMRANDKN